MQCEWFDLGASMDQTYGANLMRCLWEAKSALSNWSPTQHKTKGHGFRCACMVVCSTALVCMALCLAVCVAQDAHAKKTVMLRLVHGVGTHSGRDRACLRVQCRWALLGSCRSCNAGIMSCVQCVGIGNEPCALCLWQWQQQWRW